MRAAAGAPATNSSANGSTLPSRIPTDKRPASTNKPVRSRRLLPEPNDPEEHGQHVQFYPPWDPGEECGLGGSPTPAIPPAYTPVSDADGPHASSIQRQGQQAGHYMQSAEEARLLLLEGTWRRQPLWRLLGLPSSYAHDFLRGPDYRYAVDDEGHLVDMVRLKRQLVPEAFPHAFTAVPPPPSVLGTSDGPPDPVPLPACDSVEPLGDPREAVTRRPGRSGGYLQGPPGTPAGRPAADGSRSAADGSRSAGDEYLDELADSRALSGGGSLDGPLDGKQRRARAGGPPASPAPGTIGSFLLGGGGSGLASVLVVSGGAMPVRAPVSTVPPSLGDLRVAGGATPVVKCRSGPSVGDGGMGLAGGWRADESGRSRNAPGTLHVYTYCIGPRDVFHALWELDLLQQVVFTDDLKRADLVLHRRARRGEKQFAYLRLRARARQRGIPFVTVKDGSAGELAASLMPVFQLYRGEVAAQDIERLYGAQGESKETRRRIRLC